MGAHINWSAVCKIMFFQASAAARFYELTWLQNWIPNLKICCDGIVTTAVTFLNNISFQIRRTNGQGFQGRNLARGFLKYWL